MATITTNHIYDPYDQWLTLDYTFSGGTFSWSVTSHSNNGAYRTNIYGLTVNVGGNSYYIGDIAWGDYTPGTALYSNTTSLASCTVNAGVVSLSVSGNYYYGTWNTSYRASGSGTQAITSPTVATPTYTVSGDYNSSIVAGMSTLSFSFSATPGTTGNTITGYKLYFNGVQVYSGATASCTVTAPASAGSHTAYVIAVESNGAQGQSTNITITTVAYVYPSFESVSSIRWSTGNGSGAPADDGTYARLSATFTSGSVGGTTISTYCKATVSTYSGTINSSGGIVYSGSILSADNSYLVTYELYDDYLTLANAIIRTDTISIGGRAIDLIHDSNDGYGIGINTKAVAGRFTVKDLVLTLDGNCLWYNSNNTYTPSGAESIDLSSYSHIIIGGYAWGDGGYFENIVEVGGYSQLWYGGYNTDSTASVQNFLNFVWRTVTTTTSGVTFGRGQMVYAGGIYQNWDNRCVPKWIWGIKKPTS